MLTDTKNTTMNAGHEEELPRCHEEELSKGYENMPPDIVETTLPFLSPRDIKHLSHTNKYFHKLLNFDSSDTLWCELYGKAFGTPYNNNEPFVSRGINELKTASESIMIQRYPKQNWHDRYEIRAKEARIYTWGCLRHSRLGYSATSNQNLTEARMTTLGGRIKYGVNTPTKVPWSVEGGSNDNDNAILQISSGGFSFQILTKSGKLYSTGSTFSGGHRGPGPVTGEHDFDPLREGIRDLEDSFHNAHRSVIAGQINTTGVAVGISPPLPALGPHENLYEPLEKMTEKSTETAPGNKHIRRMFTRNCFEMFTSKTLSFDVDEKKLNSIRFIAVASGRSHFLAMDDKHDLYSWDSPDSELGIKLRFDGLPSKATNPVMKIGCGWDLNCIFIYKIGLVVWNSRQPLDKGQLSSAANYKIIPNTADISGPGRVVDFACFQDDCIVYITSQGEKLWKYSHGVVHDLKLSLEGRKLSRLNSSISSLVIFADESCYTLKMRDSQIELESLTKIQLDDQEDMIISLSSGDYHNVALTRKGILYSWGLESQVCGCLGLGPPHHVIDELHVGRWENLRDIRVVKPQRIQLDSDYTCVSLCAGGWQTGALIIKK